MADAPGQRVDAPGLLRASRSGDREALGELLRRFLPGVRAFVRLRMGPELRARESGSDIVQSVCADLFAAEGLAFDDERKLRGWLFRAALNKVRGHGRSLKAAKRDPAVEQPLGAAADVAHCYARVLSPSGTLMLRERIERLERAFDELPEHYREVVTLARVAGMTYAEVADATGRTEDAVRNILARALNKLAAILEAERA